MAEWTYRELTSPTNGFFDIYRDKKHMGTEFCSGSVDSAIATVKKYKEQYEANGEIGRSGKVD